MTTGIISSGLTPDRVTLNSPGAGVAVGGCQGVGNGVGPGSAGVGDGTGGIVAIGEGLGVSWGGGVITGAGVGGIKSSFIHISGVGEMSGVGGAVGRGVTEGVLSGNGSSANAE